MKSEPVLVVAAHADDEVLGCGGTLARMAMEGREVHVLILADGTSSRQDVQKTNDLRERVCAAEIARSILGVTSLRMCGLPDNRLDGVELLEIVRLIESSMHQISPSTVFTHHYGDVNIDHRRVHEAVLAAVRPQPGFCVRELFFFEVASSTEWRPAHSAPIFSPNYFVDITAVLQHKLRALDAYAQELREFPHPRSTQAIQALAHWRGATAGVKAAEAFEIGRIVT